MTLRRERVIVVGNGMVGHRLCDRLAAAGGTEQFEIIVFAEESRPAYDRVNLGEVLRGRDERTLTLAPLDWYKGSGISLHLHDPVVGIDSVRQQVRSRGGMTLGFDHLVLATGSSPVMPRLDLAAANQRALFTLRTWEDATRLRADLHPGTQAVILGGGFIGLETADALAHQGLDVLVIETGAQLLSGRLEPKGATLLRRLLEQRGVQFRLGESVAAVRRDGERHEVVLSSGERVPTDIVIVATGVRPRDDLARVAGLGVGPRGGVTVNSFLQTSHPRVYAIGECAAAPGVRPGHVAPGYCMADALARTLLGQPTTFQSPTQPVTLKVPRLDVFFIEAGLRGDGEERTEQSHQSLVGSHRGTFRKVVLCDRRIVAAQAVGSWSETGLVTRAVTTHARVGRTATWRFRWTGKLWPQDRALMVVGTPGTASDVVCACASVTLGTLRAAVEGGCYSLDDVRRCTGAAAGCGSCIPVIMGLVKRAVASDGVAQARAETPRESSTRTMPARAENIGSAPLPTTSPAYHALRVLGVLSLFAVAGSAVLASGAVGGGLPLLRQLTGAHWPTALWTLSSLQHLSGWGLLGLYLLGASLPLWKRWGSADSGLAARRRRRARVLHALLGLIIVAGGIAHTGGRAGANLNAWLAVAASCFLALGGLAAVAPNARAWPWRMMRRLHLTVLWPVLALIGVHLYAVLSF